MDENTRYLITERMAGLQREYALLKTCLDQASELDQIRTMLGQGNVLRMVTPEEVIDAPTSNPA